MPLDDEPRTESEVLRRCAAQIANRLPRGWTATLVDQPGNVQGDGVIEITSPSLERAELHLEVKRTVDGRDVGEVKRRLGGRISAPTRSRGVVMATYLSPQVRSRLDDAGLSFVDATGNIRVELTQPALFIADRGADKNPWRGPGRPRGTLKGEPAARVVRALADFDRSWRMRDLVAVAGTSTGAAYRVVAYLERAGLALRDEDGTVRVKDWGQLLRSWSSDYSLMESSRVTRWIAPRGIPGLLSRMAQDRPEGKYALSGTLAAAHWAEYAPATLAIIYTTDAEAAARRWGLQPTEAGANTVLAEPKYDVVLDRAWSNDKGIVIAAASQVFVDLLTGPGRSPTEAEALIAWMERHESAWRHRD